MRKLPPKILINLCISMLALLLIFLFGVDKSSSRTTCQIMAALLHYFTLTTFCWTLVEAYNLYKNFVKIFNMGGSNKKFMYLAMSFAWGMFSLSFLWSGIPGAPSQNSVSSSKVDKGRVYSRTTRQEVFFNFPVC